MGLEWMAWTPVTAGFFIVIVLMLISMTIWQFVSPTIESRGFLPIATTRGDRLFIGLLSTAYIHIGWVGLTNLNLWIATAFSVCFIILVMKYG